MSRGDWRARGRVGAQRLLAIHARGVAAGEARAIPARDDPAWLVPGSVVVCLVACSLPILLRPWAPLSIAFGTVPLTAAAGAAIWLYARLRFVEHPRLARLVAALVLCSTGLVGVAVFSYDAAALGLPLRDRELLAFDRALGWDWPAVMAWLDAWPVPIAILRWIYGTHGAQVVFAAVIVAIFGRASQLARFLTVFMLAGTITVALAALVPAVGPVSQFPAAFRHLTFAGTMPLEIYGSLRDGSLTVVDLMAMAGVVTFPSFHTVIALIVPWALRPWRWLFWPALALDALVLVATITEGGHYLADVAGGACVLLMSIGIVNGAVALGRARKPGVVATDVGMPEPAPA